MGKETDPMSLTTLQNAEHPFGDPDGARAELADIMNGFVGFGANSGWGGIASAADDRSIRVIVGKKGSGKTIYLRRLQVSTFDQEGVFSQKIQSDIPTTSQILQFTEICQGEQITEKWREMWRVSILCSLLTHILYKKYFEQYINQKKKTELEKRFEKIITPGGIPYSAYDAIKFYLAHKVNSLNEYDRFIQQSAWLELSQELSDILKSAPPVFFYLDAVDEEFAHAPMEWHQCQKGLFYAVMRLLRSSGSLGSRLHVTICIRDIVFASVLRSEHSGRYRNAPHVCKLNWDSSRVSYFLQRKIAKLDDVYFDDPKSPRNIQNFLSLSKIFNESRGVNEDINEYIVRHTRFLPRDIIEIGNELAKAKIAKVHSLRVDDDSWQVILRQIISKYARNFGNEQLLICANQIASHDMPQFSARHNYHELYTAGREYIDSRAAFLRGIIKEIGSERFSFKDIERVRKLVSDGLPKNVDVFSILWQNGLIGCRPNKKQTGFNFFNLDDRADFLIPSDSVEYAFHSCLIDAADIKNISSDPIVESVLL